MYNNMDDTMDYSVATSHTSYQKKILQSNHKGFCLVSRKVGNRKKTLVGYFTTSYIPGNKIVNAITGLRYMDEDPKYKYVVGSIQEDLLFKTMISTGENGNNPSLLFYDSPEQFEKHQHMTLSQDIKEKWHKKRMCYVYSRRMNSDSE